MTYNTHEIYSGRTLVGVGARQLQIQLLLDLRPYLDVSVILGSANRKPLSSHRADVKSDREDVRERE